MHILIGTSGFSYEDWRGYFYPEDLPKGEMRNFYARHFPTVEVNATYYRIPPPATFVQMARKVPTEFSFVVKANKEMTHGADFPPAPFEAFRHSVEPLIERGMLGGIAIDQHGLPAVGVHELVKRADTDLELIARNAILIPHIGADNDAGLNGAHRLRHHVVELGHLRGQRLGAIRRDDRIVKMSILACFSP